MTRYMGDEEMRELHRHCQCDQCTGEDCEGLPQPKALSKYTASELMAELITREGVSTFEVARGTRVYEIVSEKVQVLVVKI